LLTRQTIAGRGLDGFPALHNELVFARWKGGLMHPRDGIKPPLPALFPRDGKPILSRSGLARAGKGQFRLLL